MAAEAVMIIREAEEKAKEEIRASNEQAKQMAADAAKEAQQHFDAILADGRRIRDKIIQAATDRAEDTCRVLAADGKKEQEAILMPDPQKLEEAVKLVVERIVTAHGNC